MKDIINGGQLSRKMDFVSHWATGFGDFKRSNISG
jgi:hypothetical protein